MRRNIVNLIVLALCTFIVWVPLYSQTDSHIDTTYPETQEDFFQDIDTSWEVEEKFTPRIETTYIIRQEETTFDIEAAKQLSEPIIDEIILGLNERDYEKYSKNFSGNLKSTIPESEFDVISTNIKSQYGDYISKEFVEIQDNIHYVSALYKVKFSNEDKDVVLKVDLENIPEDEFFRKKDDVSIKKKNKLYVIGVGFDSSLKKSQ